MFYVYSSFECIQMWTKAHHVDYGAQAMWYESQGHWQLAVDQLNIRNVFLDRS